MTDSIQNIRWSFSVETEKHYSDCRATSEAQKVAVNICCRLKYGMY